jgi:hypothetical protein
MQYQNYVRDVLEFAECDRIYVKGSSPYCIFGTEKCVSPVLAVRLDAGDLLPERDAVRLYIVLL